MRKDETTKLCEYIKRSISRVFSLTSLGYEVQSYHNAVYVLYNSRLISYKDYSNLICLITHAAEERLQNLIIKGENNEKV